jgi:hypothetical protein
MNICRCRAAKWISPSADAVATALCRRVVWERNAGSGRSAKEHGDTAPWLQPDQCYLRTEGAFLLVIERLSARSTLLPAASMAQLSRNRTNTGRGGRVVDGSGLENRQGESPRGFESHPLRRSNAECGMRNSDCVWNVARNEVGDQQADQRSADDIGQKVRGDIHP